MQYVGIQKQQSSNNRRTVFLLLLFPCLVALMVYLACYIMMASGYLYGIEDIGAGTAAFHMFATAIPYVMGGVLIWFMIAYFSNTFIINKATGSKPLDRRENKKVYNLVENLCLANGMEMPKINIIEDDAMNAFASGINRRNYTVTLSSGIIKELNDEELEAVIGHELCHIRNHDVRLLIVSIVFVGIFTLIAQIALQALFRTRIRSGKKDGGAIFFVLIVLITAAIGMFFASLMRFAISRKREYMADAGSAEMTKRPLALASALRKISADPEIAAVKRKDVAQLFIENPIDKKTLFFSKLFATHPPVEKRIALLEQF